MKNHPLRFVQLADKSTDFCAQRALQRDGVGADDMNLQAALAQDARGFEAYKARAQDD